MLTFLSENSNQIALIIAVIAGLFGFIKWLDERRLRLRDERYHKYMQLIKTVSGSKDSVGTPIYMTEQVASAYFLLEYNEFYDITIKIFESKCVEEKSNENWMNYVSPEIKKVLSEIKQKSH